MSGALASLPLTFEPNVGQADAGVRFVSYGAGSTLHLKPSEAVLALANDVAAARELAEAEQPSVVRMQLVGGNPSAAGAPEGERQGETHYLTGRSRESWRSHVPGYGKVRFSSVYPGVDLLYYGKQSQLEYDFVVQPGASPDRIQLAFADGHGGPLSLKLEAGGGLRLDTPAGPVRHSAPVVYQEARGRRVPVESRYTLLAANRIGFEIGGYDRSRPLVIDPAVNYFSDPGAMCSDVALDPDGGIYINGSAYKLVEGEPGNGLYALDSFVRKYSADGTRVLFTANLGGTGTDYAAGVAVDTEKNIYVTGMTDSFDFPVVNAFQPELVMDEWAFYAFDTFVTKISRDGSDILYSTYLGGSDSENLLVEGGIAVDASGSAYVTGATASHDFPTLNPIQGPTPGLEEADGYLTDAFVAKLSPQGNALVYSTYLGGTDIDGANAIELGADGSAYVAGFTASMDFPVVSAAQVERGDGGWAADAFVTRVAPDGASLLYSTLLGGDEFEEAWDLAVAENGELFVAGQTTSLDFPTVNPIQPELDGGVQPSFGEGDAFVTKVSEDGASFLYSTYLGGSEVDVALGIDVDPQGHAVVVGVTGSWDFPVLDSPQRSDKRLDFDGFFAKLSPDGTALRNSSYLGDEEHDDIALAIVVNDADQQFVAGFGDPLPFAGGPDGFSAQGEISTRAFERPEASRKGRAFVARLKDKKHKGRGRLRLSAKKMKIRTAANFPRREVLRLVNVGGGAVQGTVGEVPAPFRLVSGGGSFSLGKGQIRHLVVEYAPEASGSYRGTLTIQTQRPRKSRIRVPLEGLTR
ncbi:MAG: SBBP repeat-containing protein [Armatimonadota bacterium]